jgi:hypothetical protein
MNWPRRVFGVSLLDYDSEKAAQMFDNIIDETKRAIKSMYDLLNLKKI